MKGLMKTGVILGSLAMLGACSTVTKVAEHDAYVQPKWYQGCKDTGNERTHAFKFWQTEQFYYACGSSVSGFEEAANIKAIQIARRNLADRLNGMMNSRTTIEYNDAGNDDSIGSATQSQVLVVNQIKDTALRHYSQNENYTYKNTNNGQYYAFSMIKLSRPDVDKMIAEYKARHADQYINTANINQSASQITD